MYMWRFAHLAKKKKKTTGKCEPVPSLVTASRNLTSAGTTFCSVWELVGAHSKRKKFRFAVE